ncbi:MAG: STAS domain-containing protein [Kiritimatiellae bacterium]|nr:STAS domain-containing protein [Kiritimatiellia bacterium]
MDINKEKNDSKLTIRLKGRLDTQTSPLLASELSLEGVTELVFDLSELEYVSSAGLRVFLTAHKTMMAQGEMIIMNAAPVVKEVFEITGFIDIFTLK